MMANTTTRVVLIRHGQSAAQATHSRADRRANDMLDCPITRAGAKQAEGVDYVRRFGRPDLIVVSPLTRALQTACIIFKSVEGIPILAHPACAELDQGGNMPENTRRPLAKVRRDPALTSLPLFRSVDFGLVEALEAGLGGPAARGDEEVIFNRKK